MNELAANTPASPIIVLDPGHGGLEPANGSQANNAVGPNGLLEKDLTLAVAQAAAHTLRSARRQVVLTRDDDRNLSLSARVAVARAQNAAVFVSIHFNGHPDTSVDGTEVYTAPTASETTRRLANHLLQSVARASRVAPRGIQLADFTVLAPANHLPQTAACLLELAFLTNPAQAQRLTAAPYVQQLGLALAHAIMGYTAAQPVGQSLSGELVNEQVVYNATRDHRDPRNLLPQPNRGRDVHTVSIPDGLRFSRWEVEVDNTSPGSGYRVLGGPQAGATGRQQVTVEWWFGPYGRIAYRLRVFASPDGRSNPALIYEGQTGWTDGIRDQMQQGLPIALSVKGPQAQVLHTAVAQHPDARSIGTLTSSLALDGGVILAIVIVIGIVLALGMFTVGALLKQAMDQGYDVNDTRYKAAAGSDATRQEHEFVFNLRPPGTTVSPGASEGVGVHQ